MPSISDKRKFQGLLDAAAEMSYADPLAATLSEISKAPPLPRAEQEELFAKFVVARSSVDRLVAGLPAASITLRRYLEREQSPSRNGTLKAMTDSLSRAEKVLATGPVEGDLKEIDLPESLRRHRLNHKTVSEIIGSETIGPVFSTYQILATSFYRWCVAQRLLEGNPLPNNLRGAEPLEQANESAKEFKPWLLSQNVDWMVHVPAQLQTRIIDTFLARYALVAELRNEAVARNLSLAVAMARRCRLIEISIIDAIEEGKLAIVCAVDNFDLKRNFQFSTYCCRAIIKAINRADKKAQRIRKREPVRLDGRISHGSDHSMRVLFEDTRSPSAGAELLMRESLKLLKLAVGMLTPLEREVIRYRFGVDDYPFLTLEEVGETIGVTKERVRQIEVGALEKLEGLLREEDERGTNGLATDGKY